MRGDWIEAGWKVGTIAAAATAGALVAFGARFGTPFRAFHSIAATALGPLQVPVTRVPVIITLAGLLLHVAAMMLWGTLYAYLVERGGGHRWRWAVVTSLAAFGVTSLVAAALHAGLGTLLSLADRSVLAVVLMLALALGMRFALFPSERR